MNWVYLALDFLIMVLAILWISKDITERDLKKKYYWSWMVAILIAYFILQLIALGFLGVGLVVFSYYIWSRHLFKKDEKG